MIRWVEPRWWWNRLRSRALDLEYRFRAWRRRRAERDRELEQRASDQTQQALHEAYIRLGPPPGWVPPRAADPPLDD